MILERFKFCEQSKQIELIVIFENKLVKGNIEGKVFKEDKKSMC